MSGAGSPAGAAGVRELELLMVGGRCLDGEALAPHLRFRVEDRRYVHIAK